MIFIDNFAQVAAQIETERGITKEELIDAIEQALVSACHKQYPEEVSLESKIDELTGEAKIYMVKTVVKKIEDEHTEISLNDAKEHSADAKIDDVLKIEVTPSNFGRLAAQTAKQVIVQRIREAEKNAIYDEFKDKIGHVITGIVQKVEGRNLLINLGRIEAILYSREQLSNERYNVKDRIKIYIEDVVTTPKGPQIKISRAHVGLLKCLFEQEIPEIQDKIIEIKSIARDPGNRAKVAVHSNNTAIGAVGTCVGHMGGRIQSIIKEINNEKIDILEWHEDPQKFISSALKPAKISTVVILDKDEKTALVVVPKDQLSLAIGKSGVNVRLAVKLTGWKIDIMHEEEFEEKREEITGEKHISIEEKIQQDAEKLHLEEQDTDTNDAPTELEGKLEKALKETVTEESKEEQDTEPEEKLELEDNTNITASELAEELQLKVAELIQEARSLDIIIESTTSQINSKDAATLREKLL